LPTPNSRLLNAPPPKSVSLYFDSLADMAARPQRYYSWLAAEGLRNKM